MTVSLVKNTDPAIEFQRAHIESYDSDAKHYPYTLPANAIAHVGTLRKLARQVGESGNVFFSKDSMRWHHSFINLDQPMIGGRFFITSEAKPEWGIPREYSVRWVCQHPSQDAGGNGMLGIQRFDTQFLTGNQARAFARQAHNLIPFGD
jgi:hypothetical protein